MAQHKGGRRSSSGVKRGDPIYLPNPIEATKEFFEPTFNMFGAIGHNLQLPANSPDRRNPLAPASQTSARPKGIYGSLPTDGTYKRQELELGSDARGGGLPDNYKETESAAFRRAAEAGDSQPQFIRDMTAAPGGPSRSASAPVDPNNTGAKGTQMTYQSFMRDIGYPQQIAPKPQLESSNLPGTPGYSESFNVDAGEVEAMMADTGRSKEEATAILGGGGVETTFTPGSGASVVVDSRITPKITLNAQETGVKGDVADASRAIDGGSRIDSATSGVKRGDFSGIELTEEEQSLVSPVQRSTGSRAFLDYDGPGGSLGALRAKEHALGIIKQGDQAFGFDSSLAPEDRELTKMSTDRYRQLMDAGEIIPQESETPAVTGEDPKSKAKGVAQARILAEKASRAYDQDEQSGGGIFDRAARKVRGASL